jgi:hypothetical protein
MKKAGVDVPKLNIMGVNAKNGEPLPNIFLELWKENM